MVIHAVVISNEILSQHERTLPDQSHPELQDSK